MTTVLEGPNRPESAESPQWCQALADGAPGIALWHIERARAGIAGLFRGAPAVAYALHSAGHASYQAAVVKLDHAIGTLIRDRLDAARRRIDDGRMAAAGEYDLINGLTGLGVYLLHRDHDHELLGEILAYLVQLTQPVRVHCQTLPGWWATGSPDRRQPQRWDGGHAGFGMAHGIAGPLALLSVAMRRGIIVNRHGDAIHTICAWLDRWQQSHAERAWWPEVIDRDEMRTGGLAVAGPHRPSWCYGTPGIARAQHLAAIATRDQTRARLAEHALAGCLTDERQLAHLTDAGLCHGWAGLVHTARRAAADAITSDLAAAVDIAATRMRRHLHEHGTPAADGLLEGAAGVALVQIPSPATQPTWDTCLLVN
jgi:hypothetical protein